MITTARMSTILQELQMEILPRQKDTDEEAKFRKDLTVELENAPEGMTVDFPVDYEF